MLETLHGESRRVYQQVFVENPAPKLLGPDPCQPGGAPFLRLFAG